MASGERSRRDERDRRTAASRSRSGSSGKSRGSSGSGGRKKYSGSSAAQRRRQREREARRRRIIVILAVAAILIALVLAIYAVLSGASGGDYTASTAEFRSDGSIRVTSVETFDQDYYDEEELRTEVSEAVGGADGVKKESLTVEDGIASLVLTYDSAEDYVSFNDTDLFIGTVEEAENAGYDFQSIMSAVSQEDTTKILNEATLDQLLSNEVIILCEEVDVVTYTGILYATSNLGVTDETHASVIDTISEETPAIIILMDE